MLSSSSWSSTTSWATGKDIEPFECTTTDEGSASKTPSSSMRSRPGVLTPADDAIDETPLARRPSDLRAEGRLREAE